MSRALSLAAWIARRMPERLKRPIRRLVCGAEGGWQPMPLAAPAEAAPDSADTSGPWVDLRYAPGTRLRVLPGDLISDALYQTGVWEEPLTQAVCKDAEQPGLMVEVGANIGYFATLWAALHTENRVFAFEPAPRNLELLRASLLANNLQAQVTVLPVAAGPSLSIQPFDLGPQAQTGWGGVVRDPQQATQPTAVIVVPLDDLLPPDTHIRILKIDVEGFDTEVLAGCRHLLQARRVDRIYYEQNLPRMRSIGLEPGAAEQLLRQCGYQSRLFQGHGGDVQEWIAEPIASR